MILHCAKSAARGSIPLGGAEVPQVKGLCPWNGRGLKKRPDALGRFVFLNLGERRNYFTHVKSAARGSIPLGGTEVPQVKGLCPWNGGGLKKRPDVLGRFVFFEFGERRNYFKVCKIRRRGSIPLSGTEVSQVKGLCPWNGRKLKKRPDALGRFVFLNLGERRNDFKVCKIRRRGSSPSAERKFRR